MKFQKEGTWSWNIGVVFLLIAIAIMFTKEEVLQLKDTLQWFREKFSSTGNGNEN